MSAAKPGDTVRIHYTGKLQDGTVFDSSTNRNPITVTLGQGKLIAGFENAVIGMNEGEKKTVRIPCAEAYGPRKDDAVVEVDRSNLPANFDAKVGQRLELTQEDDRSVLVTVVAASDKTLTLDANHPLAGKDLTFEISLMSVSAA